MRNFFKLKVISIIVFISFGSVYAADVLSNNILKQTATEQGSSEGTISIPDMGGGVGGVDYWNAGNNGTIIGNYFKGMYYDSNYGFYRLDWSEKGNENVRIVDSTGVCATGYGYKLGGYAYSPYFGFSDFDYSDNIFVYYCDDDESLHGYAYNENIGFQNFEGIQFSLVPNVTTVTEKSSTGTFVNDTTKINVQHFWDGNINSFLGGDVINLDDDQESIFYIIK